MPTGPRSEEILAQVLRRWRPDVLPLLETFARIPNQSPAFEPGWEAAGHMEEAVLLLAGWASGRAIPGAVVDVVRLPGLTPTLVVDVPATDPGATGTVLVYGHYDKQPPFDGWTGSRGPWSPVLEGDRLYARGVADDGYALPSALVAAGGGGGGAGAATPGPSWWPRGRRRAAAPTCPTSSSTWPTGSGFPTWWWRSTPAAPPTTGCG